MRPFRNGILCVALCLLVPLAYGCSDSASPGTGNGGNDTGSDAATDMVDDTAPPNDQGTSDSTTEDPSTDTGSPDIPPEDFGTQECEVDMSGLTNPDDYYEDDGTTTRDPLVRIEWVDFINNRVGLRNISDSTIEFDNTWNLNINAISRFDLGRADDLPAGELLVIRMTESGLSNTHNVFLNEPNVGHIRGCGGEIVILKLPGAGGTVEFSNHASYVQSFIMWGTRRPFTAGETFNDEAFTAGLWSVRYDDGNPYRVETCYLRDSEEYNASSCSPVPPCGTHNTQGLLGVGDVTDVDEWEQAVAEDAVCFQ